MITATDLRLAIETCANNACALDSTDRSGRARIFVARLAGHLHALGEHDLEREVSAVIGLGPLGAGNADTSEATTGDGAPC